MSSNTDAIDYWWEMRSYRALAGALVGLWMFIFILPVHDILGQPKVAKYLLLISITSIIFCLGLITLIKGLIARKYSDLAWFLLNWPLLHLLIWTTPDPNLCAMAVIAWTIFFTWNVLAPPGIFFRSVRNGWQEWIQEIDPRLGR